ncbi:MAG: SRPBCC family protein [Pseudomonadota bacterium]
MVRAVITKKIEAPARAVWELVNWKGCAELMPIPGQMEAVTFEGDGVGARRIFHLDRERLGGGIVVEELTSIDEKRRRYEYILTDNGPLPWTDYQGTILVTPCGPNACALKFEALLTPVDVSDEECRHIFITHALMDAARVTEKLCGTGVDADA